MVERAPSRADDLGMNPNADRDAPRFPALHDTSVQILLGIFTLAAALVFGYVLEPLVTFRPIDAEVVGAGVAKLSLKGWKSNTIRTYQSDIFFRYEVAGVPYMGRQYRRADLESSPRMAQLRGQSFTAHRRVRAWYNPFHPDEAVLTRTPSWSVLVWTVLIAGLPWFAAFVVRTSAPR